MTIEELMNEWDADAGIDRTNIAGDSLGTWKLHAKYFRFYMQEKTRLIAWINELKVLKLAKYEFYTQGPDSETPAGWELPAIGRIIKADVERYIEADKDIISLSLRVDMQREKIKMLESVIHAINTRNFVIKNAIEMIKFESGER